VYYCVVPLTMNSMFNTNIENVHVQVTSDLVAHGILCQKLCYFCRTASEGTKLKYIFPDIMFGAVTLCGRASNQSGGTQVADAASI
jgi:hypothetical protein